MRHCDDLSESLTKAPPMLNYKIDKVICVTLHFTVSATDGVGWPSTRGRVRRNERKPRGYSSLF